VKLKHNIQGQIQEFFPPFQKHTSSSYIMPEEV